MRAFLLQSNQTENLDVQKASLTIPSAVNVAAMAGDIEIPVTWGSKSNRSKYGTK